MVGVNTAKLNHSCARANVYLSVGERQLTLIAMVDIRPRQELLVNYHGGYFWQLLSPALRQNKILRHLGFECRCPH